MMALIIRVWHRNSRISFHSTKAVKIAMRLRFMKNSNEAHEGEDGEVLGGEPGARRRRQ